MFLCMFLWSLETDIGGQFLPSSSFSPSSPTLPLFHPPFSSFLFLHIPLYDFLCMFPLPLWPEIGVQSPFPFPFLPNPPYIPTPSHSLPNPLSSSFSPPFPLIHHCPLSIIPHICLSHHFSPPSFLYLFPIPSCLSIYLSFLIFPHIPIFKLSFVTKSIPICKDRPPSEPFILLLASLATHDSTHTISTIRHYLHTRYGETVTHTHAITLHEALVVRALVKILVGGQKTVMYVRRDI